MSRRHRLLRSAIGAVAAAAAGTCIGEGQDTEVPGDTVSPAGAVRRPRTGRRRHRPSAVLGYRSERPTGSRLPDD